MPDRRETLKIIGAIGSTCAFPFASDELYGQHVHPPAGTQTGYGEPKFFTRQEFETLSRVAEAIIPGAVAAGVPGYIDFVVQANPEWQALYREGLAQVNVPEEELIALLTRYIDQPGDAAMVRFFRAAKNMTADGYYTSEAGLVRDLGYQGNTVRESYPSCEIPEH